MVVLQEDEKGEKRVVQIHFSPHPPPFPFSLHQSYLTLSGVSRHNSTPPPLTVHVRSSKVSHHNPSPPSFLLKTPPPQPIRPYYESCHCQSKSNQPLPSFLFFFHPLFPSHTRLSSLFLFPSIFFSPPARGWASPRPIFTRFHSPPPPFFALKNLKQRKKTRKASNCTKCIPNYLFLLWKGENHQSSSPDCFCSFPNDPITCFGKRSNNGERDNPSRNPKRGGRGINSVATTH